MQANLDAGLRLIADDMFDTVVLSQTLQAMHEVESVLRERARVGREGIVSFPNFGHWEHAFSLLAGRMPVTRLIPYQWYDTPSVHLCTPKDFEILAARLGAGHHQQSAACRRQARVSAARAARHARHLSFRDALSLNADRRDRTAPQRHRH